MLTLNKQLILERRQDIEDELAAWLEETQSDFTLADIQAAIYDAQYSDEFEKIVDMFNNGQSYVEWWPLTGALSEAWNYFPRKYLGGLSVEEERNLPLIDSVNILREFLFFYC
jgi:hypothetical protein